MMLPDFIKRMTDALLQWAGQAKQAALSAKDWLQGLLSYLGHLACLFVAGFITGVFGGYLSHLALDLTTKRGLPLI